MKTNTFIKQNILFLVLGLTSALAISQTILTVDNNPGSTAAYTSVQTALNDASAGDIIYVQPSLSSYGAVLIDKALTIVGRSHSEPLKVSRLSTVSIRSSGVTLKGLTISTIRPQSSGAPIPPPFVGLEVYECRVSSNVQLGVGGSNNILNDVKVSGCLLNASTQVFNDASAVVITNNIFTSSLPLIIYNTASTVIGNNIFNFSTSVSINNLSSINGTALLFNNMFINNSVSASTVNFINGGFNLDNNLAYNYGAGDITFNTNASGTIIESGTLINTNPLFTNVDSAVSTSFAGTGTFSIAIRPEDDLTLQAGSPALTGGIGGTEMGLYNNGFVFNKIGNPRDVPTLDILEYNGSIPQNGSINVTINAKAH